MPLPGEAVVIGTRNSALARRQTTRVVDLLTEAWPGLSCEVRPIITQGDRTQQSGEPLPEIGGKGLFTAELEQRLRDGGVDLAVHSLKDLPTEEPQDVVIGAVCRREDARDCVVSRDGLALERLPAGAVVGTSSLRRAAQLRALRPDLEVRSIRGNVDTRIRKVRDGEFDAAVLAAAGVLRLELESDVTEWLPPESILPAPGQGALAVQCRAGDERVLELLSAIDDPDARATTSAERTFLRALGGGCAAPVGAYAEIASGNVVPEPRDSRGDGAQGVRVRMNGLVLSPDGHEIVRVEGEGAPDEVGERLAREALAAGADRILEAIRAGQPLRGRRVAVTRPRTQAHGLVDALRGLGAEVVVVPLIEIVSLEETEDPASVSDLDPYDWLVLTSANGVAALSKMPGATRLLSDVRIAAVGPATASAIRNLGVEPAFVPDRFAADEIVVGLGELEGTRVLLLQSDISSRELESELHARGARVDVISAYRTVAVEPLEVELEELSRGVDAVVLASGSAARSLASLVASRQEVRDAVGGAVIVCIGPKTASAAREAGLPDGLVADEATAEGIIHALSSHIWEKTEP
jgi:hydroxymethylbilane synthase